MEDIFIKSTINEQTQNDQLPCTSKPCTWNVPSKRKQEPTPIQEVKFEKHVYDKKRKDGKASTNTAPKEVGATHRKQHSVDFKLILEKIKNTEEKTGKNLGSLISFHVTFWKIQCLWMKLKALTRTHHLNGI